VLALGRIIHVPCAVRADRAVRQYAQQTGLICVVVDDAIIAFEVPEAATQFPKERFLVIRAMILWHSSDSRKRCVLVSDRRLTSRQARRAGNRERFRGGVDECRERPRSRASESGQGPCRPVSRST